MHEQYESMILHKHIFAVITLISLYKYAVCMAVNLDTKVNQLKKYLSNQTEIVIKFVNSR